LRRRNAVDHVGIHPADDDAMKRHEVPQQSDAWFRLRMGIPTASQFYRLKRLQRGEHKGEYTREAKTWLYRLVCERLMNAPIKDDITTAAMREGIENEPRAAGDFAIKYNCTLGEGGFVETKLNGLRIGCSPDRLLIGTNSAAEIKCPRAANHIKYLIEGPEDDYYAQIQGQLFVAEFDCVYFYSWHENPRVPDFTKPYTRDQNYLTWLREELLYFLDELESKTELARRYGLSVLGVPGDLNGK
jgi:hypothetical protein